MNKPNEKTEKILRIGVIHNGKIVEERLLRKKEPVTVGSDPKNIFVLPGAQVPKSAKLFDLKGSSYTLCFTDQMDGRLSVNDSVIDFAGLKSQNLATKAGDSYRVGLSDGSKGKVTVGDVTLLFQFVTPPPVTPKAALPSIDKGGILKGLDPFFTIVVTSSFLLHFGTAAYLSTLDPPPPPTLEDVGERFAKFIAPDIAKLKPPPPAETKTADTGADKKAEEKKKDDGKKAEAKKDDGKKTQDAGAKKAALQKAVASKGLLKVLGAKGGGGAFADVFGSTGPGQGLSEMLAGAGGVDVSTAAGQGALSGPRGAGGGGGAADIGALGTTGGGGGAASAVGSRQVVQVKGTVQANNVEEVDGSLDPKVITKTIKSRMAGFKACYENALKRSPNLQGKVVISFVIDEEGRVTKADVEADSLGDPEVGRCIAGLFKRIRFPKPDEGSVQASFPFVFVPSG